MVLKAEDQMAGLGTPALPALAAAVTAAAGRIEGHVLRTAMQHSPYLSRDTGADSAAIVTTRVLFIVSPYVHLQHCYRARWHV